MRISIVLCIFILLTYGIVSLSMFINKNGESLLLLGVTDKEILGLFFLQQIELLLGIVYIGIFFSFYFQNNTGINVLANVFNVCLYILFVIVGYFAGRCRFVRILFCMCMLIFSIFFALEKVNYESAYKLVMSKLFYNTFVSFIYESIFLKVLMLFLLFLITKCVLNSQGVLVESYDTGGKRHNFIGDLLHRMGKYSSFRKNYFWIYRNKQFILWKICSAIFFIVFCGQIDNNIEAMFLAGYLIGLINISYLVDIYHYECRQVVIYHMSDYTFFTLIKSHVKSGVAIIGDNIFLILLINFIWNKNSFVVFLALYMLFVFMNIFINAGLYRKYPMKVYQMDFIVLLIEMHIPVLNVMILHHNYCLGKEKWRKIENEGKK